MCLPTSDYGWPGLSAGVRRLRAGFVWLCNVCLYAHVCACGLACARMLPVTPAHICFYGSKSLRQVFVCDV